MISIAPTFPPQGLQENEDKYERICLNCCSVVCTPAAAAGHSPEGPRSVWPRRERSEQEKRRRSIHLSTKATCLVLQTAPDNHTFTLQANKREINVLANTSEKDSEKGHTSK